MMKSGLPGSRLPREENRQPESLSAVRTACSGFVPLDSTLDMIQLRVLASKVSVMFGVNLRRGASG